MTATFKAADLLVYDRILIIFHEFPDGDAIGSAVALAKALEQRGKTIGLVCKGEIPKPFKFLTLGVKINTDFILGDWEAIVLIDCGDLRRTGFPERLKRFAKERKRLYLIDHHLRSDIHRIANYSLTDQSVSATGELILRCLQELKIELTRELATFLFTAIYTDTGGFMHSNTSPETLSAAAKLLARGARLKSIAKNTSLTKSAASLRLWGIALSRVKRDEFGLVSSVLTQKDISDCLARDEDIAGVVNLINSVPNARAAILLIEAPDGKIKASLRTENETVDVSQLAAIFGGGGHKKAAGFVVEGRLHEDVRGWHFAPANEQPQVIVG